MYWDQLTEEQPGHNALTIYYSAPFEETEPSRRFLTVQNNCPDMRTQASSLSTSIFVIVIVTDCNSLYQSFWNFDVTSLNQFSEIKTL